MYNRSVPLLSKEGLGEVLLDKPPSIPPFQGGKWTDTLHVDKNNQMHINIPADMGEEVEVIIFPSAARIMDKSGFAKNILNSAEEDCWNDLWYYSRNNL